MDTQKLNVSTSLKTASDTVMQPDAIHHSKTSLAKDHPGIYVPPPLIYVALFFGSMLLQKAWPLNNAWLHTTTAHVIGWLLVAGYLALAFRAIKQFATTKNTLVTIKPAASLQTTGIYAYTRNPMYLSLVLLYSGLAIFSSNGWALLLLPLLTVIVQVYVIRKEEQYLLRAFGDQYHTYMKRVRRWL